MDSLPDSRIPLSSTLLKTLPHGSAVALLVLLQYSESPPAWWWAAVLLWVVLATARIEAKGPDGARRVVWSFFGGSNPPEPTEARSDPTRGLVQGQTKAANRKRPVTYVYVAGPCTSSGTQADNLRDALTQAERLWSIGFVPFVPHLSFQWELVCGDRDQTRWYAYTADWLRRCDAVLRMPGVSKGADAEVELATSLGIPVFTEIDDLYLACDPPKDRDLRWHALTKGMNDLVEDVGAWQVEKGWTDLNPHTLVLGMVEELGEVARQFVKLDHGVRKDVIGETAAEFDARVLEEISDVLIYAAGLCAVQGYQFGDALAARWEHVRNRDPDRRTVTDPNATAPMRPSRRAVIDPDATGPTAPMRLHEVVTTVPTEFRRYGVRVHDAGVLADTLAKYPTDRLTPDLLTKRNFWIEFGEHVWVWSTDAIDLDALPTRTTPSAWIPVSDAYALKLLADATQVLYSPDVANPVVRALYPRWYRWGDPLATTRERVGEDGVAGPWTAALDLFERHGKPWSETDDGSESAHWLGQTPKGIVRAHRTTDAPPKDDDSLWMPIDVLTYAAHAQASGSPITTGEVLDPDVRALFPSWLHWDKQTEVPRDDLDEYVADHGVTTAALWYGIEPADDPERCGAEVVGWHDDPKSADDSWVAECRRPKHHTGDCKP